MDSPHTGHPVPSDRHQPGRTQKRLRVGVVGVGRMGLPMAVRIRDAGFTTTVFDAAEQPLRRATTIGLTSAPSLANLARVTDLVVTSLPDGAAVNQVVGYPDCAADCLLAGKLRNLLVVDTSSCMPTETRRLADRLASYECVLLDAPVSGGVARARTGELTVMIGGPADVIQTVEPVLRAIGTTLINAGTVGSGHAMKVINNCISATTLATTVEGLLLGLAWGLKPETMLDVINASTSRSHASEDKIKNFVLSRSFDSGFSLALMAKDIRNARDLAVELGVPAPSLGTTADTWAAAEECLPADADHTAITLWLESLTRLRLG